MTGSIAEPNYQLWGMNYYNGFKVRKYEGTEAKEKSEN